ncbi:MAG TPA: ThiF family adenylyltransferase [Candidatus Limnocylindrales bacterium]
MSHQPFGRSEDLRRLIELGFELDIHNGNLLVHHVPYLTGQRQVQYGILTMPLTLGGGDVTAAPGNHVAFFVGDVPCDGAGRALGIARPAVHDLGNGLRTNYQLSARPNPPYRDYEQKVRTYVSLLLGPARSVDPEATAQTFQPVTESEDESPFLYMDTSTSRAGLERYAERLARMRLAIVGLGGTGSYTLDLVAKTSVAEIHLFDGDRFLQHNAFRSPGATPAEDLIGGPNKADHWARVYGRMRRGVVPHPVRVDASNVDELRDLDFVFIAVDHGPSRALILDALAGFGVPHIDVGMGVHDIDERLSGKTRVSTGTGEHPMDRRRVPTGADGPEDDYRLNIQIADLNALNATLAVIRWKKLVGVYADLGREHASSYTIALNEMTNEDVA